MPFKIENSRCGCCPVTTVVYYFYPGIFYLTGKIQFETQIIVFSRLDNTHPAYRILRPGAAEEDIKQFLTVARLAVEPWEIQNIKALLEVSVASNRETYKRVKKEEQAMGEALQELMQEGIDIKAAEKEEKGEKKGADMLASLLRQLDPNSADFQMAINGTAEDRQKLYTQYKIVYTEVGEDSDRTDN